MGLSGSDVVLLAAPLHTGTGFVGGALAATLSGAKVVLPSKEFSASAATDALPSATAISALESQLSALPDAKALKTAPAL